MTREVGDSMLGGHRGERGGNYQDGSMGVDRFLLQQWHE